MRSPPLRSRHNNSHFRRTPGRVTKCRRGASFRRSEAWTSSQVSSPGGTVTTEQGRCLDGGESVPHPEPRHQSNCPRRSHGRHTPPAALPWDTALPGHRPPGPGIAGAATAAPTRRGELRSDRRVLGPATSDAAPGAARPGFPGCQDAGCERDLRLITWTPLPGACRARPG